MVIESLCRLYTDYGRLNETHFWSDIASSWWSHFNQSQNLNQERGDLIFSTGGRFLRWNISSLWFLLPRWKSSKVTFNGYKKLENFRLLRVPSKHACCICIGKCTNAFLRGITPIINHGPSLTQRNNNFSTILMHSCKLVSSWIIWYWYHLASFLQVQCFYSLQKLSNSPTLAKMTFEAQNLKQQDSFYSSNFLRNSFRNCYKL